MKRTLFLTVALSLAVLSRAQTAPAVLVLRGGTLVDVTSGKEFPSTTIVIRGERIDGITSQPSASLPDGAQIVDATGKWIVPGLIDSHAHAGDEDTWPLLLYLANGITTIRNPGGNITQLRLTRDELTQGKSVGPRLFFAGPLLDGMPPLWPAISFLVDSPDRARSAVNFLADQGVDFIKTYNNVKEPELRAIVAAARERGLPVAGHIPRTLTMVQAIEIGMTRLEHIRITGKEMLSPEEAARIDPLPLGRREAMLWQRYDLQSEKMRALVERLSQSRVFLDPTLSVVEMEYVSNPEAEKGHPNNQYLSTEFVEATLKFDKNPMFEIPPELKPAAVDAFHKEQKFVGMCNQAGVRIIAGTDGPDIGKWAPGFGLHRELELLVESGLTPLQALRAATSTAAEALGQEDRLGTVECGKFADLVLLDADPLEEVQNLKKIHLVVRGGKTYSPALLLRQAQADAHKAQAPSTSSITPKSKNEAAEQELLKLEQEWNNADLANDWIPMDRILADDYVLIDRDGGIYTKEQCRAAYTSGSEEGKILALVTDDMKVRVYGDAAVVTGRAAIKEMRQGKEESGVYRITDTWIKRAGRWQCVSSHGSKIVDN